MPPGPALVSGIVLDPVGNGVAGARVSFAAGPVPLPDIAALTDARGAFTLSAPVPGEYIVQCVADGYRPRSVRVSVRAGEHVDVRCQLVAGR